MGLGQEELDHLEVLERSPGWRIVAARMDKTLDGYRQALETEAKVRTEAGRAGELQGSIATARLYRVLPQILMDDARKQVRAEAKAERKR
jgi:hypothetical protein